MTLLCRAGGGTTTGLGIQLACLIALSASACAGSITPPQAAGPATLATAGKPAIQQSRYAAQALAYLEQNRAEYGIAGAPMNLRFAGETVDALNQKHVRFQQFYDDVPVWRREIIVHVDARDKVYAVSNGLASGLGAIDVTPRISVEAARNAAARAKGEGWLSSGGTLTIFLHEMRPHLAYEITLRRGLQRWFVFVDAGSGEIIHQLSGSPSVN